MVQLPGTMYRCEEVTPRVECTWFCSVLTAQQHVASANHSIKLQGVKPANVHMHQQVVVPGTGERVVSLISVLDKDRQQQTAVDTGQW